MAGTAVYGTVRTVVWEDGGREPSSYPIVPDRLPMESGLRGNEWGRASERAVLTLGDESHPIRIPSLDNHPHLCFPPSRGRSLPKKGSPHVVPVKGEETVLRRSTDLSALRHWAEVRPKALDI